MTEDTRNIMFSSKGDEWETPKDLFNKLDDMFNFTLDPASTEANHLCPKYYTQEENGLSKSWEYEHVFLNPPYSDIATWVAKAAYESQKNHALVVLLIPSRTDTKYFADLIMKHAAFMWLIKGRLKFRNKDIPDKLKPAPFPSVLVLFHGERINTDGVVCDVWRQT